MHGMSEPPEGTPHDGPPPYERYNGGGGGGGGRHDGGRPGSYYQGGYEGNPDVVDNEGVKGVDAARMKLVPWLARIVDSVEQESPLQVTLCHVTTGDGAQEVSTAIHELDGRVSETVDQLLTIAEQEMTNGYRFSGAQVTYAFVVTLQDGKNERYTFLLHMPRRRALQDAPRMQYSPDQLGERKLWMEQTLQLTEFALESASAGKDVLLQMIHDLRAENHRLKRHQFERDHQIQILIDGNMKRQMMVDEHKAKIASSDKMIDTFKSIIPMVLAFALPPHLSETLKQFMGAPGRGDSAALTAGSQPIPQGDTDVIDQLIMELESDQEFFLKLFNLMGEKPRCFELLGLLHQNSARRREERAKVQADEAARRQDETMGSNE